MREVGAFEAKNTFGTLLDLVEAGEEVTITRRGKPVAKLVKNGPTHDVEAARAAVEEIRGLAKKLKLGKFSWDEWKSYRDEGRR